MQCRMWELLSFPSSGHACLVAQVQGEGGAAAPRIAGAAARPHRPLRQRLWQLQRTDLPWHGLLLPVLLLVHVARSCTEAGEGKGR